MTAGAYIRAANAALLRGDFSECERQCELAAEAFEAQAAREKRLRELHPDDSVRFQ